MSFNFKTLIVFDSNMLRSTDGEGQVVYTSFAFGGEYPAVENFVKESGLEANVKLAVPAFVIEELKRQKERSFIKDIDEMTRIVARLTSLPNIAAEDFKMPDGGFDCPAFIQSEADKYIANNDVCLLELKEEDAPSILQKMMDKVIKHPKPRRPFFVTGSNNRIKDAGFKDSVIWEVFMHYKGIADFDKVIFVSNDSGFNECKPEFEIKWGKHFEIVPSAEALKIELSKDYGNFIENRKVYEYAKKDYFIDYIDDLLKEASQVIYEGESLSVENYKVTNICKSVNQVSDEEGDFVSIEILTEIVIFTTLDNKKIEILTTAKTVLSDLDYMEIEGTTFEPEIA